MIITTSWDDGHPLDLKLLDLLEKYNLKATFYIPIHNSENSVMGKNSMRTISDYQEIGGHTLNHTYLNSLNDTEAEYEISQCKIELEEIIGKEITAFCYPGGKFSNRDVSLVKKYGFLFGRTTRLLTCTKPSSNVMDTTIQMYNHSSITLLSHCVKNFNILTVHNNSYFLPFNKDFLKLAEYNLLKDIDSKCVFHIWGHSWEIEKYNLWRPLEDLFKLLNSYQELTFLNNTDTWKSISSEKEVNKLK